MGKPSHIIALALADVRLPSVFSSHMVLQRDVPLPVWGWADPGEQVTVQFRDQVAHTRANTAGEWQVALPEAVAGGPDVLTVSGTNTVAFQDVLVGEVWLCSGQSNMEMGVAACLNAQEEIAAADHPATSRAGAHHDSPVTTGCIT